MSCRTGSPFGGPAYYIRNVVYNTPVALKFINPAGVIVYHNTFIAESRTVQRLSNAHFKNNLFLGTDASAGIAALGGPTAYSTYDYNGYRPNRGAARQFTWLGPKSGVVVDYEMPPEAAQAFSTRAELAAATGQETHGIDVDYDIFKDPAWRVSMENRVPRSARGSCGRTPRSDSILGFPNG